MKRISLALLAILLTLTTLAMPTCAHADDASKRAKVEEMIRLTKIDQLMDQMIGQMSARMKTMADQQATKSSLTPEQQKLTDDFQAKVQKLVTDAISWDKIKPIMVAVYAESYTEDELDGIVAFYRTPAGQAILAKTPQIMARTMDLMQQQMATLQPQMQQATRDYTEQMKQLAPPAKP